MWGRRVVVNGRGGRDQEAARAQKVEQRSLDVGHLSRPCRPRAAQQRPLPVRQRHHPVLQRLLPCAVSGEGVGCQMQAHLARAQRPARHIAFVTEVSPRPGGTPSHNCSDVEVSGVELRDSAFWTLHPVYSKDIHIHDLNISAPAPSPNTVRG